MIWRVFGKYLTFSLFLFERGIILTILQLASTHNTMCYNTEKKFILCHNKIHRLTQRFKSWFFVINSQELPGGPEEIPRFFFLFWNFYFILVFEATIKTNATFFLILPYCGLVIWRSSKPLLCWEIVGMAKPKFIKLFKRNFYTHIQLFYSNIRYCVTDDDEDQWIFRIPISLLHSIELNMTNWA